MIIESETAEVHEARRTALELLLGDHVGDCLSPCQRICPLQMNIPLMLRQVVRAMSEGQSAVQCVHQFLLGRGIHRAEKPFSSVMGRLGEGELNLFMRGPNPTAQVKPSDPAGYSPKEAACEASRCLHCDCRAAGHCALQRYAALYHADARRFQVQRPRFEQYRQSCGVIFEPGKCILCGICVKLSACYAGSSSPVPNKSSIR